jgi:hypothetical protein
LLRTVVPWKLTGYSFRCHNPLNKETASAFGDDLRNEPRVAVLCIDVQDCEVVLFIFCEKPTLVDTGFAS